MQFEWDEQKAEANLKKHEVSFDEAKTVFDDLLFIIFADLIILLKKIVLLLWASQIKIGYWLFLIRNVRLKLA